MQDPVLIEDSPLYQLMIVSVPSFYRANIWTANRRQLSHGNNSTLTTFETPCMTSYWRGIEHPHSNASRGADVELCKLSSHFYKWLPWQRLKCRCLCFENGKTIGSSLALVFHYQIMWKNSVITASDRIFPGLVYHDREKEFWDMGNVIRSSLPLQIALYLNVWAFPAWFLIALGCLDYKYCDLSSLYKFITITVLIIFTILENIRLYFGYLGNLAEKIPELASFWLISTLLQLPLAMFLLLDANTLPLLVERIADGVMIVLLVAEIATGTIALKKTADHHARRFYMAQLYGIDNAVFR